jgi:hypothetical protein
MNLPELLTRASSANPPTAAQVDLCLAGAGPLPPSTRAQLRGYSLAALDPEDFYGVVLYFRHQRPSGRVSLAEVPLPPGSRQWLLDWPQKVSAQAVRGALENCYLDPARGLRASEALALVVLWFAAEHGRETAEDGEIWTCVAPAFPDPVQSELFTQGHPRQALKSALETCCTRFDLRHAFGREGAQAYYQTVYLQFGLTRRGMGNLENWLGGATPPRAVVALRAECPAFAQLWDDLKKVHEGRAHPDILVGRAFLPPGWTPGVSRPQSPFRLIWSPQGEVLFEVRLQDLFGAVPDGHYELTDEGSLWLWVTAREQGFDPAQVSALPGPASWLLRSLDGSGQVQSAQLDLPEDDILLWDEVGNLRRADCPPRRDWTVRLGADWKVVSPVSAWLRCGPHAYYRIQEGPLLLLDQDGCEVALQLAENPLGAVQVRLDPACITLLPTQVSGVISHFPADCRLQSLSTAAGAGEHQEYLQDFEIRLAVDASLERPSLAVRLRARDSRSKTWTRTCSHPLDLDLITWKPQGQWQTFQDLKVADVAQLESTPFRFFLKEANVGLLEGDHFLGRPPTRTTPLTDLAGVGGPLLLRPGPYNSSGKDRVLVHTLQNQGICHSLQLDGQHFRLQLRRPIYPDHEFRLIWWDGQNSPEITALPEYDGQQRELCGIRLGQGPAALALAYRGLRLGAVWKGLRLMEVSGFSTPLEYFAFLRWLQLPFLEWTWTQVLQQVIQGHEASALLAWVQESDLALAGLTLRQREPEAMLGVARELLAQQTFEEKAAWELLRQIPYQALLHIHPRLLLSLLQKVGANQEMRVIYRELLPPEGITQLRRRAAEEMGVDCRWLELCCERYFAGHKPDADLRLALSCHAFQELVTVLALE